MKAWARTWASELNDNPVAPSEAMAPPCGFSTKVLDFMAAGIPVVASRTRIDTRYFDDSRIRFFPPESVDGLAEAIVDLYRDPARRAELGRSGRQYIRENNWEVKKALYERIIEDLVGPGGSRPSRDA